MNIEFLEDEHIYLVDGVIKPSVSAILEPISQEYYKNVVDISEDKERASEIIKMAGKRGSNIHKATESLDLGKEVVIDDKYKGYLLQYKKFKAIEKPIIEKVELILTNGDYCGTIDRILTINGIRYLIDIKTSSKINQILVELQEGGYKKLVDYNKLKVDKYAVLHLSKTNYTFKEIIPNEEMFNVLYENYKIQEKINKYIEENIK